jgi:tRNA(Ile)-lysidine synthase
VARLAPPVAAVRGAVRRALTRSDPEALVDPETPAGPARVPAALPDGPVLVACSGGADSLALAAAAAFVAPRLGRPVGLVTVDHGLQPGSARRGADVARWAAGAGFDPVELVTVEVAGHPGGPEAAARAARYRALVETARRHGAAAVLLGHTRDDQAETVLLALARGSGPRGIAGMPVVRDLGGVTFLRPLLGIDRDVTRKACAALGLEVWEDPHNADPRFARSRVRADLLPALVRELGPGVVENLARTARLAAADNAALDQLAATAAVAARTGPCSLAVTPLAGLAPAVRTRVLHSWARELGAAPGALSLRHVSALDALITRWRGQGAVYLPGGIRVSRRGGILTAD